VWIRGAKYAVLWLIIVYCAKKKSALLLANIFGTNENMINVP
jgi:hypothetical protein